MAWGKPPLTVNVGTPGASGDLEAVNQSLEHALSLLDHQVAALAKLDRHLELLESELKGIHARIDALYPALDRLYRRAGVRAPGRRRPDDRTDAHSDTAA